MQPRTRCFSCYRPKSSCMCEYINPFDTNTQFIILMHPKEFKKTKNGTGHFTHLLLKNSLLFVGIDFDNNKQINNILNDPNKNCYVLYPSKESIELNSNNIAQQNKQNVIFLIDSTWPCSKKILAVSKKIGALPKISFTHNQLSQFRIKEQPNHYCLSTIESTLVVLKLLNQHKIENISQSNLDNFLLPFTKMVDYQLNCIDNPIAKSPRFLKR